MEKNQSKKVAEWKEKKWNQWKRDNGWRLSHKEVWEICLTGKGLSKTVGGNLKRLRDLRNNADYDDELEINDALVDQHIATSQDLVKMLGRLQRESTDELIVRPR